METIKVPYICMIKGGILGFAAKLYNSLVPLND